MDEQQRTNPEGFEPAPEQHEASPFDQYVPEPPAPPMEAFTPDVQMQTTVDEVPAVGALAGAAKKRKPLVLLGVVLALVVIGIAVSMVTGGDAPSPAPSAAHVPMVPEQPVAPANIAPTLPAPVAPVPTPSYSPCEKQMADFAVANGADPKDYIAQNRAWLAQCNQAGNAAKAQ